MKLTIDNLDGAGARDYTAAIERGARLRVHRTLNATARLECSLCLFDPSLVVPVSGARVALYRDDGEAWFTGYVGSEPEYEFLGWSARGPMYRFAIAGSSDECLWDARVPGVAHVLSDVTAGSALAQLTRDVLPGDAPDESGIAPLGTIFNLTTDCKTPWSEHAAKVARRARGSYRFDDGKIVLESIGARVHAVSEDAPEFSPDGLRLRVTPPPADDLTVVGPEEPAAYVTDYLAGDGVTREFALSEAPFGMTDGVLLEESFEADLDPLIWGVADPAEALAVENGALLIAGGSETGDEIRVSLIDNIEVGGALDFDHGIVCFDGACDGVVGGLFAGGFARSQCFAGFLLGENDGAVTVSAFVRGSASGEPQTIGVGSSVRLRTRTFCAEAGRAEQAFVSSARRVGGAYVSAPVRVVLEVAPIDLAHAGALPVWTALCDEVVADAPPFATYALVSGATMHAAVSLTRIARAPLVEVRCARPGEEFRTIALAQLAEGADAKLAPGAVVQFYEARTPAAQERIAIRYRGTERAAARVRSRTPANHARVCSMAEPPVRDTRDCRNAALAMLDDWSRPGIAGEYRVWSDALAADVLPGDLVALDIPSRGIDGGAVVREVWIEPADDARAEYRIRFANDAAEAVSMVAAEARGDARNVAIETAESIVDDIAPVRDASIISIAPGMVIVDAGCDPPPGGGFEVRCSDAGWGGESAANLLGRFTDPQFWVERPSAVADFCVRAYDASTPPRYSRVSAILHVDYPV